jgi:hypothetical protein
MQRILIFLLILAAVGPAMAQSKPTGAMDQYFSSLPAHLALKEPVPERYAFTTDYFQLDTTGNLINKHRVYGEYTRGLPGGKAQWDNVRIAQAKTLDEPFPAGDPQAYMDGFSYNPSALSSPNFFAGFPDNLDAKNLVYDTVMFETFAWSFWDKLKLDQPYRLHLPDTSLTGGSFHNQQPELTWIGLDKRNGKLCALIQYEAFFNKLQLATNGMTINGRSHYWGTIWVSLNDKQIEYGTLREDVLSGITMPGPNGKQNVTLNVFREGTFERMK